jgi:hypothetical protein
MLINQVFKTYFLPALGIDLLLYRYLCGALLKNNAYWISIMHFSTGQLTDCF